MARGADLLLHCTHLQGGRGGGWGGHWAETGAERVAAVRRAGVESLLPWAPAANKQQGVRVGRRARGRARLMYHQCRAWLCTCKRDTASALRVQVRIWISGKTASACLPEG